MKASRCACDSVNVIQYTVYSIQYTVYSVQCTVYSIQYTVYSIQYTVYCIQYTVYSIQYTVYSIQCTVYSIRQNSFFILKHYKQGYMFRLKVSHLQAYTIFSLPDVLSSLGSHSVQSI